MWVGYLPISAFGIEVLYHVMHVCADVGAGLHGSSASQFALQTSDVNIYLSIPEAESRHEVRTYNYVHVCSMYV